MRLAGTLIHSYSLAQTWNTLSFFPIIGKRGRFMPDEILRLPAVARLLKVVDKTAYTNGSEGPASGIYQGPWTVAVQTIDLDRSSSRRQTLEIRSGTEMPSLPIGIRSITSVAALVSDLVPIAPASLVNDEG
jgi:hypothetical protein